MDPLAPLITALHDEGRLRVWSLIITVFGDSVQPRGGTICSARLGALLGRIGVEPGAQRTALSRLARDGWIDAARAGRLSHYRLTRSGKAQFADATHRIYAPPQTTPITLWTLSLEDDPPPGAILLGGLVLRPAQDPAPRSRFRMTGTIDTLTPDLHAALPAAGHLDALRQLRSDLAHLERLPDDPLSAAAARTLLIHRWRRLILRFGELHSPLLPPDWQERPPRSAVARAWHRLTPLAEQWWDSTPREMKEMAPPDPAFHARFGAQGLDLRAQPRNSAS